MYRQWDCHMEVGRSARSAVEPALVWTAEFGGCRPGHAIHTAQAGGVGREILVEAAAAAGPETATAEAEQGVFGSSRRCRQCANPRWIVGPFASGQARPRNEALFMCKNGDVRHKRTVNCPYYQQ